MGIKSAQNWGLGRPGSKPGLPRTHLASFRFEITSLRPRINWTKEQLCISPPQGWVVPFNWVCRFVWGHSVYWRMGSLITWVRIIVYGKEGTLSHFPLPFFFLIKVSPKCTLVEERNVLSNQVGLHHPCDCYIKFLHDSFDETMLQFSKRCLRVSRRALEKKRLRSIRSHIIRAGICKHNCPSWISHWGVARFCKVLRSFWKYHWK